LHVSQASEHIELNNLDKDFSIKDLYLETKQESKSERLEYILGEKPRKRVNNRKQIYIF